jgi:hypothetical protein
VPAAAHVQLILHDLCALEADCGLVDFSPVGFAARMQALPASLSVCRLMVKQPAVPATCHTPCSGRCGLHAGKVNGLPSST